ncbi:hypothetical protein [Leptospira kmetyi]|uniref:hypothetical protein n=1 Tax=Leptospira kmetyi TaxID=408139 RepID=UPI0002886383|nr:hypothetical protein [Leptospira kmetyi]
MENSQSTLERKSEKTKKGEGRNEIERLLNKYGWSEEDHFHFVSKKIPRIKVFVRENFLEFLDDDKEYYFTDSVEEIESILKFINYMAEIGIVGDAIPTRTYKFMARFMYRD